MSRALHERLATWPRKRVPLATLKEMFYSLHPEAQNSPERGALLLRALRDLSEQGVLSFPASGSWERVGQPPLPNWISLSQTPATEEEREDPGRIAWVPEIGFWTELQPNQLAAAKAINAFLLRRRGSLRPTPIKERSIDIFGDEKRLDALRCGDTLFGGRLHLEQIGAFQVILPLLCLDAGAPGRPLLVVENYNSHWSLGRWNRRTRHYSGVAYGGGEAFRNSGRSLAQTMSDVGATDAEYLGDLDPRGVAIPLDFNRCQPPGHPRVRAAMAMYRWLLDHGHRSPQERLAASARPPGHAKAWLGPELGLRAEALWAQGQRIAQECLGNEQLNENLPGGSRRFGEAESNSDLPAGPAPVR